MSSWEEPGLNTLVPPVVKPDQRGQPVGTVQKGKKRVKGRGWLALGVFFLTTAIGYGLIFLVIDNWLKG